MLKHREGGGGTGTFWMYRGSNSRTVNVLSSSSMNIFDVQIGGMKKIKYNLRNFTLYLTLTYQIHSSRTFQKQQVMPIKIAINGVHIHEIHIQHFYFT